MIERCGWLLEIIDDQGRRGWGECAPLPTHGSEDFTKAAAALLQWSEASTALGIDEALDGLSSGWEDTPAARAAIECALLDLLAQEAACPLALWLSPAAAPSIAINATAGAVGHVSGPPLQALAASGFGVIKLKLGLADPEAEIAALHRAGRQLPSGMRLRLDANAAWDMATAQRFCRATKGLPIESLEEPLRTPTLAALRALQDECDFPLAVDESWPTLDHEAFFAAPPVRRLTLKLAAQGGLLRASKTAAQASAAGIACVVTSGIDGACGTLAAAHLAASLQPNNMEMLAHGLGTSDWLECDNGNAPAIIDGRLQLPARHGLGFDPKPLRHGTAPLIPPV